MDMSMDAPEPAIRDALGLHMPHQPHQQHQQHPTQPTADPITAGLAFYVYDQQQQQQSQHLLGNSSVSPSATTRRPPYVNDETYAFWSQDPMDLDYDPELASWVNSWDAPPQQHLSTQASLAMQQNPQTQTLHQQVLHHQHSQLLQQQHPPPQGPLPPQPPAQHQQIHNQPQPQLHRPLQLPLSREQDALLQQHQPQSSFNTQNTASAFDIPPVAASFTAPERGKAGAVVGPDDLLFPDDETAGQSNQIPSQQQQQQQQSVSQQQNQNHNAAVFPDTPSILPAQHFSSAQTQPQAPRLDLNDPAILEIYDDMLIFSRGNHSTSDKLTFDSCNAAKEAVLHRLALRFKLSYSYDPVQGKASIWRSSAFSSLKQTPPALEMPSPAPNPLPSSQPSFDDHLAIASATPTTSPAIAPFHSIPQTLESPRYFQPNMCDNVSHRHHSITAPVTFPLLQQDTNTVGLSVGLTPPPAKRMSSDSSAAAAAVPSSLVLSGQSFIGDDDKNNQDTPSLGDRLSSSWNIFHHGISSRRPRGRRGPLSAKSRKDIKDLEWAGGACWRCKILRRKCDPGIPCKNCPAPDLREDAPPWPLIGCRRGNLRDAMPPQVLCTKSRALLAACSTRKLPAILAAENVVDNLTGGPPPAQPDVVSQCFREAEMQCLSDNKLVLDNPGLFIRTHHSSLAAHHFSQAIRNGRYRANDSLNVACQVHEESSTYSDLISSIAWELADNSECLNVLEIESVESLMTLLETACLYEVEVGKSPMVALSLVCLRKCLDALRLNSAHILDARLHSSCQSDRCSINCLRELASCIDTYIEELSLLMFRKVNLRDRRWWLSTFYSLCIQAYVRRALLVIEQQLLYPDADDADVLFSSQYLHLVTVLFIAVSFQYDPLVSTSGGLRLQQSLLAEEDGSTPDMFVPDRYFAAGRTACAVHIWLDEGIKSSYQFLTRLLNIGSLDFDMGQVEGTAAAGGDVSMEGSDAVPPLRRPHGLKSDSFSTYSSPNSSTTSFASSLSAQRSTSGVISPASSCGPLSSASSPRTSLLMSERRSSIGSLPSRLSAASFPSYPSVSPSTIPSSASMFDSPNSRQPPPGKAGLSSKADSIISESGCSSVGSTATATNVPTAAATTRGVSNANDGESGGFICTCCPKRPQRFDTPEELKEHQTKKPHICAFCGRRFSRMNEAERHITTIHLRPFSWSCRRLVNATAAFQRVSDGIAAYDVCGFCGKQFKRPDSNESDPFPQTAVHTEVLTVHIEVDHKLHECKASAKKFYREDMFGQHLKLSHAAEPGVWLKFLENACKADEKEGGSNDGASSGGAGAATGAMVTSELKTVGLTCMKIE